MHTYTHANSGTGQTDLNHQDNQQLFTRIYTDYWNPLIRYSRNYLDDKETCKEIVQDLFVHLHGRISTLKVRTSFSSYLYTALRHKILNYLRDSAVYKKHISIAAARDTNIPSNVEQLINFKELQEAISIFLPLMKTRYREVFLLRHQDQLTVKRIAAVLHRPIDTVEKQLRKANQLLRAHLEQNGLNALQCLN